MDCFDFSFTFQSVRWRVSNLQIIFSVAVRGSPSGQRHAWSPLVFHCSLVVFQAWGITKNWPDLLDWLALNLFLLVSISGIPWRCGTNTQSVTAPATRSHEENFSSSSMKKNSFFSQSPAFKQRQLIPFDYIKQCIMVDFY